MASEWQILRLKPAQPDSEADSGLCNTRLPAHPLAMTGRDLQRVSSLRIELPPSWEEPKHKLSSDWLSTERSYVINLPLKPSPVPFGCSSVYLAPCLCLLR
jgi:hypothetical protein